MNDKRISEISEIEKVIKCPCGQGTIKLRTIYVNPKNGRIGLSYSRCSYSFCSHGRGLIEFTDIIIPELSLGE